MEFTEHVLHTEAKIRIFISYILYFDLVYIASLKWMVKSHKTS